MSTPRRAPSPRNAPFSSAPPSSTPSQRRCGRSRSASAGSTSNRSAAWPTAWPGSTEPRWSSGTKWRDAFAPIPRSPSLRCPAGVRLLPVRDATLEALADLDARAFQGTVDDLVVGGSVAHYADMMRGLLDSQMGRFLDEASTLLLQPDPLRLVGGVLCAETSPREAVIQDLMVEPERRGHGEGRFLLRWGLRALHALGYATATLWVTEANRSALRLYETEGFLRTASTVIFHWGRPDGVPQPQTSR